MNKLISVIASLCILTLAASCSSGRSVVKAPDNASRELKAAGLNLEALGNKEAGKWVAALADSYTPWQKMSLDGSLSVKNLPLDPSVKIYMERGSLLLISMRVPLLGEVGRIEIDTDSALIVNRRGKCYTRLATARLLNRIGVNLSDFQDLLLGRVFLAGSASLARDNVTLFSVSEGAGGNLVVSPKMQRDDAEYGFTIYPDGKMFMAVAFTTDETYLLQNEYAYPGKNRTDIDISITAGKKQYRGTLSYGAPDTSPSPLKHAEVNPSWRRVSLSQLFSAF